MHHNKNSVYARWIFLASFTVATILPVNAQVTVAQLNELPDPAKPGGAQPRITPVEPRAPPGADQIAPPEEESVLSDSTMRFEVNQIVLDGVIDRPDIGITVADVQALVDAGVTGKPEGFTLADLPEARRASDAFLSPTGFFSSARFGPEAANKRWCRLDADNRRRRG